MRAIIAAILLTLSPFVFSELVANIKSKAFISNDTTPEFLTVEDAFKLEVEVEVDQKDNLRFYWQIAPNYYLYKNKFGIDLILDDRIERINIVYPPAITRTDEYFGEVEVFYNTADLTASLMEIGNKVPDRSKNVSLKISSQGCADAGLCYALSKDWFQINLLTKSIRRSEPLNLEESNKFEIYSDTRELGSVDLSTLFIMFFFAFVGGVILNLMPCIFPILSLKIISFSTSNGNIKSEAWSYAFGVIFSFILVAAILIIIQNAGKAIGWGFQLQSPAFVTILAYLFLILGLALSGVIQLGGSLMNFGDSLTKKSGLLGSFFTGVLAVVVASPCSAPFMGTALGFAVTQEPIVTIPIFIALGGGMAAPLVLLAYSEKVRMWMPKPGAWMETLKQFLAFPLYASAVWLLWVVGSMLGTNTMTIILCGGLVLIFGFWLATRNGLFKIFGMTIAFIGLLGGVISTKNTSHPSSELYKLETEIWSEELLSDLRKEGKPVFVDVTAKWCITCLANEATVLLTAEMSEEFRRRNITYLVADWTEYNPDIARFIERNGRTGIPLYLFYPRGIGASPIILPQILTFSRVIEALDMDKLGDSVN